MYYQRFQEIEGGSPSVRYPVARAKGDERFFRNLASRQRLASL